MSAAAEAERRDNLRVQVRLDALVKAIVVDGDGRPRLEPQRRVLVDAARAALDRLAEGGPSSASPDSAGATSDASLAADTVLAHTYTVRDRIGRGGLAEIYQVRHRDLRTDHAVKILRADRALDPVAARLHLAEARALMTLDHEAIPRAGAVLRHGDGRSFIVMDLLHGQTLAQALGTRGPLPPEDLVILAKRLAGALAHVHAAGLVHGDVSPENVMLCGSAAGAMLIDFGVVRRADAPNPDVEFAGKWSVAAPEQLAGDPGGTPADLYALGLLLACAARGERLPMGTDRDSARAARRALGDPGVGGRVGRLIGRLLQDDPARRPTAAEAAAHLERRLGGWLRG